jgi:hypothetical protein
MVAEAKSGGPLPAHSLVHHVDGDKLHNAPGNLYVCKSKAEHRDIHTQLESLSMRLVAAGVIRFDHLSGRYYIPQEEKIVHGHGFTAPAPSYSLVIGSAGELSVTDRPGQDWAAAIPLAKPARWPR